MRILLIRHAEPDYPHDSLTEKGFREAALLRPRLAAYDLAACYVSPLGRARATAACALEGTSNHPETLDWLQEFRARIPDPVTGQPRLVWDLPPRFWTAEPLLLDPVRWVDAPMFDGENVRSVWDETCAGVDALMARYGFRKDGPVWRCDRNAHITIALFCHFAISMVIAGYLLEISPMVLLHRCFCAPSAVTELVTEERIPGEAAFRMTKLGDLTHLEANGEPRSLAGLFPEVYTGVDSTDQTRNGCQPLLP